MSGEADGGRKASDGRNEHDGPRRPPPTFRLASGPGGFSSLESDWTKIAQSAGVRRYFQSPRWYGALFEASLANPQEFLFLSANAETGCVGICPLHAFRREVHGIELRALGLFRHPHATLADFAFAREAAASLHPDALCEWLDEHCPVPWDLLELDGVPQRSSIAQALSSGESAHVVSSVTGHSAYLGTESEDAAFGALSPSFLRNLRRLARRAGETAPLRFEVITAPAALPEALNLFLDVEASGWKGAGGAGSAIALDPALSAFYRGLAMRFGAWGECAVDLLWLGDRVIAAQFCLLAGGTLSVLKTAYREEHSALAPGNLVMERALRWCCENEGVNELSFVTDPVWGHVWKPRREDVWVHRVFRPGAKGHVLEAALRLKRWWAESAEESRS